MATYANGGKPAIAFANQKHYIAVYVLKPQILARNATALANIDHGKGCLRFADPAAIDFAPLDRVFVESAADEVEPC